MHLPMNASPVPQACQQCLIAVQALKQTQFAQAVATLLHLLEFGTLGRFAALLGAKVLRTYQ